MICDKCGKDVTGQAFEPFRGFDLCPACADEIELMITKKEAPAPEVYNPEQALVKAIETPEKPKAVPKGGARKKLDKGKILALHKAGWSNAKIADETGCNRVTIWRIIHDAEEDEHVRKLEEAVKG